MTTNYDDREQALIRDMDEYIARAVGGESPEPAAADVPSFRIMKEIDRYIRRRQRLRIAGAFAAAVVPLFILCLTTMSSLYRWGEPVQYRTVEVPTGERMTLMLADGTSVTLNSETTLAYPEVFGRRHREVKLVRGEAFFDVAKDERAPFTVTSEDVTVSVLGTQFDINTYGHNSSTIVYLKEGSVRLTEHVSGESHQYLLQPGDLFNASRSTGYCSIGHDVPSSKIEGWMHNRYQFVDAPLADVIKFLERHYGMSFRVEDTELYRYTYTMSFYNESIDDIMAAMRLITPINFTRVNDQITVYAKK